MEPQQCGFIFLNLYTKSYYLLFNKALRKLEGIRLTREYKAMQKVLDDAMEKLPVFEQGTDPLLRSAKFTEKEIRKMFKVGKDFTDAGFFSTTHSEEALMDWMANNPADNVLFKVMGKNGKLIEKASNLPLESEVLFKSGTTFTVESVNMGARHPLDQSKKIVEIILKEK